MSRTTTSTTMKTITITKPLKGSGKEIGELPPVECTYPDCQNRFKTEAEMKAHKLSDPKHDYCRKCDVDCKDWEDLTQHKINMMAPWLEGGAKHECREEKPKHIVCEFCGEDFKSFGGRRLHRSRMHPAEQTIVCPAKGCHSVFHSAAQLVAHLERGQCEKIMLGEFQANVLHKKIVPDIVENSKNYLSRLHGKSVLDARSEDDDGRNELDASCHDGDGGGQIAPDADCEDSGGRSALYASSEDGDGNSEGGVLLDQEDEAQKTGYKPLQPQVSLSNLDAKYTRAKLETWPRLPGQLPSHVTESLGSMSIGSSVASVAGSEVSDSEYESDAKSRRGGRKVYSASVSSSTANNNDTASVASIRTAEWKADQPKSWTAGNASQTLFPNSKPTPTSGEPEGRQPAAASDNSTNILHIRYWDPASPHYDPQRFLHPAIQKYCCPFPFCEDVYYDDAAEVGSHLRSFHLKPSYRCPLCLKIFRSATGFVAHSESSGKCRVRESKHYVKFLDEISGGFLKVKQVKEPKIYRPERALAKVGEPVNGVTTAVYASKMPSEK